MTGITVFKNEVMDITCTNAENYAIPRLIYFMSFESCLESGQFISWNMSNTWIHLLFMTVGTHDISYMTSNARWSECNLLCNADTSGLIECYIWHVGIILMICRKKKHINEAKIPMSYTEIPICLHKILHPNWNHYACIINTHSELGYNANELITQSVN